MPANVSSNRARVSCVTVELASNANGIALGTIRSAEACRSHLMTLIALAAILEAIFLRIALRGDLRPRIVETIGWLLLSGLFYIVSSFVVLRLRRRAPPAVILAPAILFRLTFWPLYPE